MDDKALTKFNTSGTSLINSFSTGNLPMPYANEIFLLNIWIAGLNYYEAHSIEDELNVGNKLLLKREPKNQYDNLAIEMYDAKNRKLGYVPRTKNEVISRLMDGGKLLYGIITEIEYEYLQISADIFMSDF